MTSRKPEIMHALKTLPWIPDSVIARQFDRSKAWVRQLRIELGLQPAATYQEQALRDLQKGNR